MYFFLQCHVPSSFRGFEAFRVDFLLYHSVMATDGDPEKDGWKTSIYISALNFIIIWTCGLKLNSNLSCKVSHHLQKII